MSFKPIVSLLSLVVLSSLVSGHVEMTYPAPLRSRFYSGTAFGDIDYSMNSPLNADGSNYPCKGFNDGSINSLPVAATLRAGETLTTKFDPNGATHGGGSCQFSVSYDGGENFVVIHSIMGGCPTAFQYDVPIPSNLPSADKALFAWSWFNKIGNREMYMNCAVVGITGSSSNSFTGPGLYRANVFGSGTCNTVEGEEYVFPNPGKSVAYGGSITPSSRTTSLTNCNINNNFDITVRSNGSSSQSPNGDDSSENESSNGNNSQTSSQGEEYSEYTTTTAATTTSEAEATVTRHVGKGVISTTVAAVIPTTTASPPSEGSGESPSDDSSNNSGNNSNNGQNSGSNSGGAYIECISEKTFSLCGGGRCTYMGAVANGTKCVGNSIVHDRLRARHAGTQHEKVRRGRGSLQSRSRNSKLRTEKKRMVALSRSRA